MDPGGKAGLRHLGEAGQQKRGRDAGEAFGIGPEGREFEGADAGLRLFGDARGAFGRVDGAIQRDVDAGLGLGGGGLAPDGGGRGNQVPLVIRHIHD